MFLRVTTILLVSFQYLLAAENSTTAQLPALSTSFGNTTTRETETTEVQNASNFVTENLLVVTKNSHELHQESKNIEQNENSYNFLRPRGKTKFIFENIVHASGNSEDSPRNETTNQGHSYYYTVDQQSDDSQRQQLQLATIEKEEFIQSELHNLAKDIAETELNREAGKTDSNPRPSTSWKSFFSNIFPQGIMNVFHLSVAAEPSQKPREFPTIQVNRIVNPIEKYQKRTVITEWSTLPAITPPIAQPLPITPPLPIAPPFAENPPSTPIEESSVTSITPETLAISEENKNGTVMTNKDVFDINSAAEVSEMPFETVIPMESRNVFHIHPLNCEDNCDEESEDYVDQISETGEDNVVAFSREAPKNLFYPTPQPSFPYATDVYYSGTGTQTSEEIIRENTKDFGQKLPHHPAKQLDDFQKEVEKQFDPNEVRIDSEAASRKFLKHFKGKYVKPQQSGSEMQFQGQSSSFKGINHFELIASTLKPEINFHAQPSPLRPDSKLHTYIYSAGFKSDSEPRKTLTEQPKNGKLDNPNNSLLPYPTAKPGSILRSYIFSSDNSNNSVSNAGESTPPWITPNKNSDTKETVTIIPNQINSGNNRLYTSIYSAGSNDEQGPTIPFENSQNGNGKNENNVKNQIKDEKALQFEELYGAYSTNLKPESLLHTYVFSAHDKNFNNNNSISIGDSGGSTPKPEVIFSSTHQGLSSFRSTQKTYLCSDDQLKNGDCPYSTTSAPPNSAFQQKDIFEIQKSLEQQVKHTKPYVYYNVPPGKPMMLSKNPIRVAQMEDLQQSESLNMPESYQQRQQYLQDQQKQLNQQQNYFQQQQIQQYQQKLQYQQLQEYQQKQREQMQKQQEQLQEYQQKQQQQLQQYQQIQQQQRDQQQLQLHKQQQQHQQQVQKYQLVQQQQRDQQQMQKQQQHLQQYQQEQQTQRGQQQLIQMQQQEHQKQYEKQQKHNILKVEKIVPKPYPVPVKEIVEKIVERPYHVQHIVEKPVEVPYPVREVVEKFVDRPYPVEKIVDRPVHIPYPVQVDHFIDRPYAVRVPVPVAVPVPVHQYIDRPYPVEKIIEKPIQVPYPVEKIVEKIVEKHIPVEVERIVEKPAPKKPKKKPAPKAEAYEYVTPLPLSAKEANKQKHKAELEELLQLVPPPVDQKDHDAYKTLPDDVEFILIDDYNGPVPMDHQGGGYQGYQHQGYKPEKRATKNHQNIKRSPEFRRNLRVEYGFRPPLIPSVEIGEKGLIQK